MCVCIDLPLYFSLSYFLLDSYWPMGIYIYIYIYQDNNHI